MKSTPIFSGKIPLQAIGYKYNYRNALGFIATVGSGSTEPVDPYLSRFPDIFSNVSSLPVIHPHLIIRYFSACNEIDNKNRMRQSDLALEKYWVTQSGYFRLAATVELGMGIEYGNLLLCHGISDQRKDKSISMIE